MISTFYLGADGQNFIKVPVIIIINIIIIIVFIDMMVFSCWFIVSIRYEC